MFASHRAIHAALIGVAVAFSASCGGGGDEPAAAATVNGTDIPVSRVEAQYELMAQNPQAQQTEGANEAQQERQLKADALNQLVYEVVLRDGAEELEVSVSDEDIESTRAQIATQFGGDVEAMYTQLEEQGYKRAEIDRQIELVALQDAVIAELGPDISDSDVQKAYDEGVPARHVLVDSEEKANDVLDRIEGGEDFAKVAQEASADGTAQQGGELGFVQPGATVPEFEQALFDAEDGEVVGPVQSDFGFHVIQRLEKPPFAEAEEQLRQQLEQRTRQQGEQEFQKFITERLQKAEVELASSEYGTWSAEAGRIVPEEATQTPKPSPRNGGSTPSSNGGSTPEPTDG